MSLKIKITVLKQGYEKELAERFLENPQLLRSGMGGNKN